jgi:thiol-disulfide isomerase/thioredoxin
VATHFNLTCVEQYGRRRLTVHCEQHLVRAGNADRHISPASPVSRDGLEATGRSPPVRQAISTGGGSRLAPYPSSGDRTRKPEPFLMPRRVLIAISIGVAVTLLAFVLADRAPKPRPAPPLPSQAIDGTPVALAGLRGHAVLINFFASWCVPCQREAPALARFASSAVGRGHLVGVDTGDTSVTDARKFVARYGWQFSVLNDAHSTTANDYRLDGLPTTYVVDASGRIVSQLIGAQTVASLTAALKAA